MEVLVLARGLAVWMGVYCTFFEWPPMLDAFHASSSMNAAPNVPVRKDAARSPALLCGTPDGSKPSISAAPRMVGSVPVDRVSKSCTFGSEVRVSTHR